MATLLTSLETPSEPESCVSAVSGRGVELLPDESVTGFGPGVSGAVMNSVKKVPRMRLSGWPRTVKRGVLTCRPCHVQSAKRLLELSSNYRGLQRHGYNRREALGFGDLALLALPHWRCFKRQMNGVLSGYETNASSQSYPRHFLAGARGCDRYVAALSESFCRVVGRCCMAD